MATLYSGDAYNSVFDIKAYLHEHFHNNDKYTLEIAQCQFDMIQQTLSKNNFTGPRLLEIGGGPNLGNAIQVCTQFPEIVFSDYSESCRRSVEKWVENTPDAIDWSRSIQRVCDLEGKGTTWEDRQALLRRSIKEIIHCDLLKSNPLEPKVYEPFDAIMTSYCVETASPDKDSFKESMKNIIKLLKPGGILIMVNTLNASRYLAGQAPFFSLPVDEPFIREAVVEAGCSVVSATVWRVAEDDEDADHADMEAAVTNGDGVLFLTAIKQ
ncbi:nicotinamide N-methyltransferase-like [Ptychodera flava]|uniref:nicotinamide N-methyltransferase-like n=1 Tax=Ptychodera flava TaxID=63121 RepID=UPI003969DBBE